jgi:hypothetical protein
MGAERLLKSESIEDGLSLNVGRGFRFTLTRQHDDSGFENYIIENTSKKQFLRIPRFIFEIFRSSLQQVLRSDDAVEESISFKGKVKFRIEVLPDGYSITAVDKREGADGQLTLNREAAEALAGLLHDPRVRHGSDVLSRILAYHRLFKFTFAEGSDSLNSGLALRSDVLSQVEDYIPPVGQRAGQVKLNADDKALALKIRSHRPSGDEKPKDLKSFKSRLGERSAAKAWAVDYQALFGSQDQRSADRQPKVNTADSGRRDGAAKHVWELPILASEVRSMRGKTLRCELSAEDVHEMRETFLTGSDTEFFVGFDLIDVIFKSTSGKLKTFRFPLYYAPVSISESGRQILLDGEAESRIYLNHLALATLVQSFSGESNLEAAVDQFFRTILSQRIDHDGRVGRIYLSRQLPVADEIFHRTREIILGNPGENGKGGLLSSMNIVGAECDTERVCVYKASKIVGPLQRSLEMDLEMMQDLAHRSPEKFARTLPGRFLSTTFKDVTKSARLFCDRSMTPVFRPQSTRKLMDRLNAHDVVLLEGPPGTGKTFTIMNLLIHAVCTGQRVLIVSDADAALHALNEKILEYLESGAHDHGSDPVAIWKRAVQMVDKLAGGHSDLSVWCRTIETSLGLADNREFTGQAAVKAVDPKVIESIDHEIQRVKAMIAKVMDARIGPKTDLRRRVSPKRGHATTVDDIQAFVSFLKFMGGRSETTKSSKLARIMVRDFVLGREYLSQAKDKDMYETFAIPDRVTSDHIDYIEQALKTVKKLLVLKPKSMDELTRVIGSPSDSRVNRHLFDIWSKIFPIGESGLKQAIRMVKSIIRFPGKSHLRKLESLLSSQLKILRAFDAFEKGVWRQLQIIHEALGPSFRGAVPLSLEVCRFATSSSFTFGHAVDSMPSVQELLEQLQDLDRRRSEEVRKTFIAKLATIVSSAHASKQGQSNALTVIGGMLHGLKGQASLDASSGSWRELQEKLISTFPVWMCRKQAVSFLFPCKAKLFDLVIVDEATQCRVDDALPLMLRARKFMVVGDDKQTVLAKNSVIDDYLFTEFNLDEHLRGTQARGIKGGGSHIFGLVKGIKEASVMLDEHYRCPPDIIEYSNRYVYNSELKVMQWRRAGEPRAMTIDWSERGKSDSQRLETGQYKGIETDMVDRYLEWVANKVKEIEKETGRRINMETDVALVYFLLKNEPYIRSKKSAFLEKLGRGKDVLDGAGAALQGKERPYIFYLWDINRGNMMAFRHGDDPDKRKGELNVLMSRPKRRAYHYLHKRFDELDHERASISDFLWRAWRKQDEGEQKKEFVERTKAPGPEFFPWRRSSGQLMIAVLDHVLKKSAVQLDQSRIQTGVVVGDPRFKIDVVVGPKDSRHPSIGLVDLCGFDWHERCADDIVDYYFQLCRAEPKIKPIFLFIHEIADQRSRGFSRLMHWVFGQKN